MIFERLAAHAEEAGKRAQRRFVEKLARRRSPKGVDVEAFDGGIHLFGKRLKKRIINDINVRNFWR